MGRRRSSDSSPPVPGRASARILEGDGLEPDRDIRWVAARATLRLPRAAGSAILFGFSGRIFKDEIKNRSVYIRVHVDGREVGRVFIRRPIFGGPMRVPMGATISFELHGVLSQTAGNDFSAHVWELTKPNGSRSTECGGAVKNIRIPIATARCAACIVDASR